MKKPQETNLSHKEQEKILNTLREYFYQKQFDDADFIHFLCTAILNVCAHYRLEENHVLILLDGMRDLVKETWPDFNDDH